MTYDPTVADVVVTAGRRDATSSYVSNSGHTYEVLTFEPTAWGSSSFGHVATVINGTAYSLGPNGMTIEAEQQLLAENSFRSAVGLELQVSADAAMAAAEFLISYNDPYSVIRFSACVQPVVYALGIAGVSVGTPIFPVSVGNALLDSGRKLVCVLAKDRTPSVAYQVEMGL